MLTLTEDGRYILGEIKFGHRIVNAFIHDDNRELMVMAETHIDWFNRTSKRRNRNNDN